VDYVGLYPRRQNSSGINKTKIKVHKNKEVGKE
jgi:hypothetical protein